MFKITSGSIIGRSHVRLGMNNQDAHIYNLFKNGFVAVVCDGCGSGMFSEVGSTIGSRMVANMLNDSVKSYTLKFYDDETNFHSIEKFKSHVNNDLIKIKNRLTSFITNTSIEMGDNYVDTITNNFLFTIIGAVAVYPFGIIFSLGDGCYAVNENFFEIKSKDNTPPYIGYNSISSYVKEEVMSESKNFVINEVFNTEEINSIMIGTDGVLDIKLNAEKRIPGKKELVGPISQFWTNEKYTNNSSAITRKLAQISRDYSKVKDGWLQNEQGYLSDDTTLILIKRIKNENIFEKETNIN